MNNPNPFVPQTTLLDQKNKTRARFRFAILTILGCNIALVCVVLLFQGCKRDGSGTAEGTDANHPNTELGMDTSNNVAPLGMTPSTQIASVPTATNPPATQLIQPPIPPSNPDLGHSSEYVVVKGDIMDTIAKNHKVTLTALKAANPTVNPSKMPIGTKLTIPAPTAAATSAPGTMAATSTGGADSYTVKAGDNLTTIAKTHGTSISAIQALNNLKSTQIKAGQTLRMPPRASAAMNSTETPMTPAAPGNSSPVPSSTSLR
jgi:LysM repeat protein